MKKATIYPQFKQELCTINRAPSKVRSNVNRRGRTWNHLKLVIEEMYQCKAGKQVIEEGFIHLLDLQVKQIAVSLCFKLPDNYWIVFLTPSGVESSGTDFFKIYSN